MSEEKRPTATNQVATEESKSVEKSLIGTDTVFLGVSHKAGEFTDEKTGRLVQYDNILVYVQDVPEPASNILWFFGSVASELKIHYEDASRVFGYDDFDSDFNPEHWIGRTIDVRYNKKGKISSIRRL